MINECEQIRKFHFHLEEYVNLYNSAMGWFI